MKKTTLTKRILALLLAALIGTASLAGTVGIAYAEAHPQAVNQGKTDEEIQAEDLEAFSERTGYDYHEAAEGEYAPGELIVEISSTAGTAGSSLNSIEDAFSLKVERVLKTDTLEEESGTSGASLGTEGNVITSYFVTTDEEDIISLCDALNERDDVFNAQPNFRYDICEENEVNFAADAQAEAFSDPPAFATSTYTSNLQWWFDYCNITTAWQNYADSSTGYGMGKGINVAVIDTGCNTAHEDIIDNLWGTDSKCGYYAYKSTNIKKNDSTMDANGHGSHCCGTIAMSGDNTVGGIGTAPKCKLMVMKADRNTGKGSFYDSELITSLEKSAEFGADIISMSLGGYNFSYSTYRTYQKVSSSCLIVCAAGNEKFDTTEKLHFPSAASCVIGVMALGNSSSRDKLATFSNYDTTGNFYKVTAPGTSIYSLKNTANNEYCMKNGTSMATPATAGMIASYMSYIKYVKGWDWTPAQYQYRIEYVMSSSSNTLSCGAYSQSYHPVAYAKNASFKVMNLKLLFSNIASTSSNPYSNTSAVSFTNSTILDGVKNSTGLAADKLDTYALKRVALMYWGLDSTRKGIADYTDLTKLTGLNYLDLSGSSKFTSDTIANVISKCPATLVHLDLSTSTKLGNLSCLASAKFPCLHYLDISSNDMTSLSSIAKFTSLKTLIAASNSIVDISPLANMTHIEKIDLNNNKIQDPNPAFASDFCNYIDLSHNCLTDHTQLLNYKGAYHDSDFYSETINYKVDYNNMTGLTSTYAATIRLKINNQNTVGSENKVTTLNFTYSNQTAPASSVPMTSFSISNKTISREALCAGNLNQKAITGFTPYPSNANQYSYLNWSCSEPGYFASDGTVLVTPEKITSCRTLTLTATAPEASGITTVKTMRLSITAPEIYNAYLTDRVVKTGTKALFLVCTNLYTDKICLKTSLNSDTEYWFQMPLTTDENFTAQGNGQCKVALFALPSDLYNTAGNYSIIVFAADSNRNYTKNSSSDISGKTSYPYKSLGTIYVKDTVTTAEATALTLQYDTYVNRYGHAALFTSHAGTSSTSPAKPTAETYGLTTPTSQRKYIGSGTIYTGYGMGYFGKDYTGYPSTQTGTLSFTLKYGDTTVATKEITSVEPAAKYAEIRNAASYKTDGYMEYLIKTNTAATEIKAYSVGTTNNIASETNHIATAFNDTTGTYGTYQTNYSYKLWSVKVPLDSSNQVQAVTLVAADPLGDGAQTLTPATGIQLSGSKYFYPGDLQTMDYSQYVKLLPLDSEGNSLANCCNSLSYTSSNADYFSMSGRYLTCNMDKVLTDLADTTNSSKSTNITVKLNNSVTASAYVYAYRPYMSTLTVQSDASALVPGGTVKFSVKTYGTDTIHIRNVDDKYSSPVFSIGKTDPDVVYTEDTDSNGNTYMLWTFYRTFPEGDGSTMKTYVRGTYEWSDELTIVSQNYSYKSLTSVAPGDYSAWEAQCARLDESRLPELAEDYGEESSLFNERLERVTGAIESANLSYTGLSQNNIDSQTSSLKNYLDDLFGYTEYQSEKRTYARLMAGEYAAFIGTNYHEAAQTQVNDWNAKALANAMHAAYTRYAALLSSIQLLENYLYRLSANIPELNGDETPILYGAESYAQLKAVYTVVTAAFTAGNYDTAEQIEADRLALMNARQQLHQHSFVEQTFTPKDGTPGYIVLRCTSCEQYCACTYDAEQEAYTPTAPIESPEEGATGSPLPAPAFNIFTDEGYDYSAHAGSLRLSEDEAFEDFNTTQGLRFTASMQLPEGVNYQIGAEGNAVIELGYVYSQTAKIAGDINKLMLGEADVYSVTVNSRNEGVFDGNWKGVSFHEEDNTFTFNLVVNVKAQNWNKDYCARAYVKYNFNGITYTVYDSGFSSRNVVTLANAVLASPTESQEAKDYCQHKILDNMG